MCRNCTKAKYSVYSHSVTKLCRHLIFTVCRLVKGNRFDRSVGQPVVLCKQIISKHSPTRLLTLMIVFAGLYYLIENIYFFRYSIINDLARY